MEALERRLLLSCTTDFTDGILTITCDDGANEVVVGRDSEGAITLNEDAITDSPMTDNTDGIVILGGGHTLLL